MKIRQRSIGVFVVWFMVMVVVQSAGAFVQSVQTTVTVTNNTGQILWVQVDEVLDRTYWHELHTNGASYSFTYDSIICPRYFMARIGTQTTSTDMIVRCLDGGGGVHYDQCRTFPTGDLCKSSNWSITKDANGKLSATKY